MDILFCMSLFVFDREDFIFLFVEPRYFVAYVATIQERVAVVAPCVYSCIYPIAGQCVQMLEDL